MKRSSSCLLLLRFLLAGAAHFTAVAALPLRPIRDQLYAAARSLDHVAGALADPVHLHLELLAERALPDDLHAVERALGQPALPQQREVHQRSNLEALELNY